MESIDDLNENCYQFGRIYRCISKDEEKIYVGCTTGSLKSRRNGHKSGYYAWKRGDKYTTIYDIIEEDGIEDFRLELLEYYPCKNKGELEKKEKEWMKKFGDKCINLMKNEFDRPKWAREYREANLEQHRESVRIYSEKPEVRERRRNWAAIRIECNICGRMTTNGHKSTHQQSERCKEFAD
jgi:hypothetical protein